MIEMRASLSAPAAAGTPPSSVAPAPCAIAFRVNPAAAALIRKTLRCMAGILTDDRFVVAATTLRIALTGRKFAAPRRIAKPLPARLKSVAHALLRAASRLSRRLVAPRHRC